MIGILNYGVGNLKAFANIFKNLNVEHKIIKEAYEIEQVDKLILPGVGSFDSVMQKLKEANVMEVLNDFALVRKSPVLGICVGMQILAKSSEEGVTDGLGWLDGTVKKFDFKNKEPKLMIPQIGWNEVIVRRSDSGIFKSLEANPHFYFLHSYYFECEDSFHVAAEADYGGLFCCAVQKGNIFGTQFHPEKSHHNGVQLLKNFASI
ncbi:imidazole glycerol phosphate synthase subunit HisH [Leptospira sp. 96542]|nr:imidazole glycerol phosphate synthase subunit HisH [Leptospira sp. 96542]